jgi:nitroreductase
MLLSRIIIIFLILVIVSILFKLYFVRQKLEEKSLQADDTLTVIHRRKSVKKYLDKPVKREDLEILLKAGMAAPTAGDRRPWAFVVVTDKDKLVALAEGLKYGKMLAYAGAAIVVCGVPEKALEKDFWVLDCSAASENILLAAEAIKLGAVWTAGYPWFEHVEHIRTALGIPEDIVPLNVISIGHPVGIEKPKNKYNPANIHWDRW